MLDHAILGKPREHPNRCSKCDQYIPSDAMPLMLFADGRDLMWVYCERCEETIFMKLQRRQQ
jgi:hypothetical protein